VYWQRVEKSKGDSTVPMPQHMGKYVRKALNDGLLPHQPNSNEKPLQLPPPYSEKLHQGVEKNEPAGQKNETTNTHTSMISPSLNEVNDEGKSVTFQKEEEKNKIQEKELEKESMMQPPTSNPQRDFKKPNKEIDWKEAFTPEEKKYLAYLLRIIPEKGEPIEEKHATWWIKHFGIEKIKTALQVYWQQVEKAKKSCQVPMPACIGAYVREALNKGIQPCRENDRRNKAFAEQFKRQMGWDTLTIKEKYCRAEEISKEWYYILPEALFIESLKSTFENYCSHAERRSCVA
jgi:hypothetical protein